MAVNNINMLKRVPDSPLSDDSYNSDSDRTYLPKKVPPKVKRKKGGRKHAFEESKRKKLSYRPSGKESPSDKESDGPSDGKTTVVGQRENGDKKRGRPKTCRTTLSKNEGGQELHNRKPWDKPPTPVKHNPSSESPVGQKYRSGESFLQDSPCFEVAPKLAKCCECKWTPDERSHNTPNIFCRFYGFRRLRYTKSGRLKIAGFLDPHRDASREDLQLWLPLPENPPADLDLEMSRFLLLQVGDQFCDLLEQEKEAITIHMAEDKRIAWKRVVQGVREMCDVCETTLFNFHWACGKCGFVVCIDCYKGRRNRASKMWSEPGRDRDEKSWLQCTKKQEHEQDQLILTQIIAGDSLQTLGRKAHEARATWGIPMHCGCPLANTVKPTNHFYRDLLTNSQLKTKPVTRLKEIENEVKVDNQYSPLAWLADIALSNEDKKTSYGERGSSSDSDEDKDGNFSTLRELLIRPAPKSNQAFSPTSPFTPSTKGKKSLEDTLDEVLCSVIEHSAIKEGDQMTDKEVTPQLKHFVRRIDCEYKPDHL